MIRGTLLEGAGNDCEPATPCFALSTAGYSWKYAKLRYLIAENQSGPPKKYPDPYEVFIKDSVIRNRKWKSTVQKWKEIILIWINEMQCMTVLWRESLARKFHPKENYLAQSKSLDWQIQTPLSIWQVKKNRWKTVKPPAPAILLAKVLYPKQH